ncbi:MAG: hypothetical protein HY755_05645 [Nitrospirae bacterium]|nr:hypothetical protein [Nitrospirota bacterium]
MPVWKKAGNIVLSTPQNLKESIEKDISMVLIDLRKAGDAKKEHIKGAVSVLAEGISKAKDKFPADKKAPIVLYAGDTKSAFDSFKNVRGWGYTNTSVLSGGIEAWKNAGNPVEGGELKTDIVYVPKPRPGEITVEEFKKIAETLPSDKLILDVKDVDEATEGMLVGAKNIPTQDIQARLSEIPKDKEIIAYCNTGVRAEMAYHILKDAGYKARFLNANLKIDKNGKYEISKE